MKRIGLFFATVVLAGSVISSAAVATPTGLFGNTLQITHGDGSVIDYYVNADGSYQRTDPDGTSGGTWAETDGQMCFTEQTPTVADPECGPLITQNPGDSWTATRPDGSSSQLTIVSGR